MFDILPKTRWAPLDVASKIPRDLDEAGAAPPRDRSDFERCFEPADVLHDVAEHQVLRYADIEDLPSECQLGRWNMPASFAPIASFPSVAAAAWFIAHLESMSVNQTMLYGYQLNAYVRPEQGSYTHSFIWRVYNEHRCDGGEDCDGKMPKKGWETYCWFKRSLMAGYSKLVKSQGGPWAPYPEGTWLVAPSSIRRAYGERRGEYDRYVTDLEIEGIAWASGKAWLIGKASCFAQDLNTFGREGCSFVSGYFESDGTRLSCAIDTPMGQGQWYYQQYNLESWFRFNNIPVSVQTGAKTASISFDFI